MNIRYYFCTFTRDHPSRLFNICEDIEAEWFSVSPIIVKTNSQNPYVLDAKLKLNLTLLWSCS